MDQLTGWGYQDASDQERSAVAERIVDEAFGKIRSGLVDAISSFIGGAITPAEFFAFEMLLLTLLREFGRVLLQTVVQSLEPDDPRLIPGDIVFQCGGYRRRRDRTRNGNIATRFGNIVLWRRGYRSWQRGEETIFPLERMLGLTENVSPALLDLIGKSLGSAGMSQQMALALIREQCGVSMGVKRLRKCLNSLAESLEPLRHEAQLEKLIELLTQADRSSGSRKPVLSVGRDGITLREYQHRFFEVATAATVSVYDRAGKRLGTVYLAYPPEAGQATMDRMLTDLLTAVLSRWTGPLPRLAYVTDSGSNEVDYYDRVLRKMKHPISGKRLGWQRVADFYHTSERVWTMANALFTKSQEKEKMAWARRMLKNLKRPSGASRVLHSAASLYHRRKLGKARREDFWKAYRYLQHRTRHMKYHDYRNHHLPIGSGVTEAACKTIFTQRLKLSGMRWTHDGARRILTLRTILLSGTWESTYGAYLSNYHSAEMRPYERNQASDLKNAA
jgi:hypothetical protein